MHMQASTTPLIAYPAWPTTGKYPIPCYKQLFPCGLVRYVMGIAVDLY